MAATFSTLIHAELVLTHSEKETCLVSFQSTNPHTSTGSRWKAFAASLGLAMVSTACAIPENVAVTRSPLAMGSVHLARVEAIYPVFIPGGLTFAR
jgi:hypothetical protein